MDFRHLSRLTDEIGMIQFSVLEKPDISSGYTVDDNARALLVALQMNNEEERKKYALVYTRFLYAAQRPNGTWYNLKSNHRYSSCLDSDDSIGRAFTACSIAAGCNLEEVQSLARTMLVKALPAVLRLKSPRGMAYALLGVIKSHAVLPQYHGVLSSVALEFSQRLVSLYQRNQSVRWKWFEDNLTYCNAILPHALFAYYAHANDKKFLQVAEATLGFLEDSLFARGYLNIVGNQGWWSKGKEMPLYDQQPIDACSLALASLEAFRVTGKKDYWLLADFSRAWYWGKNLNQLSLYNFETGGCHDALTPEGVNLNQGAEAIISFLMTQQAWQEEKGKHTVEAVQEAKSATREQVI